MTTELEELRAEVAALRSTVEHLAGIVTRAVDNAEAAMNEARQMMTGTMFGRLFSGKK